MSRYPIPYKWLPKNPSKYIGDVNNIWVRSSWEKKAMIFFDENPDIIAYNSEEIGIKYISPVDNKMHTYYPDFIVKSKSTNGIVITHMIEVKPSAQCVPPKQAKRNTKRMITEVKTYAVNTAKWEAAKAFCDKNNMKFQILDEFSLGIAKRVIK